MLREVFGHPAFRPGQREVIEAVLAGRDCLAIMPTGAGKSATFQIPARAIPTTVLVVSPLIALMRDQVAGALRRGLAATWIDSTLTLAERDARLAGIRVGAWELVYVSPEGLLAMVSNKPLDRVPKGVPVLDPDDVAGVAAVITKRFPRRSGSRV